MKKMIFSFPSPASPVILSENHFQDGEQFLSFLEIATSTRIRVLNAIALTHPSSIYDLAKTLKRDQPTVLKDVRCLEAAGLVRLLVVRGTGRARLVPIPVFNHFTLTLHASRDLNKSNYARIRHHENLAKKGGFK